METSLSSAKKEIESIVIKTCITKTCARAEFISAVGTERRKSHFSAYIELNHRAKDANIRFIN